MADPFLALNLIVDAVVNALMLSLRPVRIKLPSRAPALPNNRLCRVGLRDEREDNLDSAVLCLPK